MSAKKRVEGAVRTNHNIVDTMIWLHFFDGGGGVTAEARKEILEREKQSGLRIIVADGPEEAVDKLTAVEKEDAEVERLGKQVADLPIDERYLLPVLYLNTSLESERAVQLLQAIGLRVHIIRLGTITCLRRHDYGCEDETVKLPILAAPTRNSKSGQFITWAELEGIREYVRRSFMDEEEARRRRPFTSHLPNSRVVCLGDSNEVLWHGDCRPEKDGARGNWHLFHPALCPFPIGIGLSGCSWFAPNDKDWEEIGYHRHFLNLILWDYGPWEKILEALGNKLFVHFPKKALVLFQDEVEVLKREGGFIICQDGGHMYGRSYEATFRFDGRLYRIWVDDPD